MQTAVRQCPSALTWSALLLLLSVAGCAKAGFRAPGAEHITPAMRNKLTARRGPAAPRAICISTDDDDDDNVVFMPVAHGQGRTAQPALPPQQQRLPQQGRQQQQDGALQRKKQQVPPHAGGAARAAPGAGGRQPTAKR